ncbi:hypothetical protein [Jiella avicenniae]|uniref:Uncharacterized protein n=1 Tax=Jiella avicenniae TaxID=2907202 RepID=A0A9X1P231_9HYPH|nr:hypothetical protein [Jiella avicenniae]MCE7029627.1 hypothetical protein [Jiella avicenniae]
MKQIVPVRPKVGWSALLKRSDRCRSTTTRRFARIETEFHDAKPEIGDENTAIGQHRQFVRLALIVG